MTPKQRLFCLEYLLDMNGTQAAIRAGYSERSAASIAEENLRKLEIATFIAEHHHPVLAKLEITKERLAEEMAKIGFSDVRRAVRWGRVADPETKEGEPLRMVVHLKDSDELDDDTAAAISEISEGPHGLKLKMHDKLGALNSLAKLHGYMRDELQLAGPVTFVIENAPAPGTKS